MYHFLLKTVLSPEEYPDLYRTRRIEPDQRASGLEYSYFEILTACLLDLARTDCGPCPEELEFLHEVLGLSDDQARELAQRQGFMHYRRVFSYLTERQKMELFGLLLELAMADQRLDPDELVFLERTLDRLRLKPDNEALARNKLKTFSENTA